MEILVGFYDIAAVARMSMLFKVYKGICADSTYGRALYRQPGLYLKNRRLQAPLYCLTFQWKNIEAITIYYYYNMNTRKSNEDILLTHIFKECI